MNAIIEFSLRFRALMVALFVLVIIGGVVAFLQLNIEAYPDPVPPLVDIVTQNPGQSAEEIERYITIPIEVGVATGPYLNAMRTISLFGLSDVKLQFTYDLTYEEAEQKVLNRLSQLPALQNQAQRTGAPQPSMVTVSVDEKPGLQAIANTAPDLPPVPGKHPGVGRDHEYKRLGTCSILAALDLHEGHVTARVERRHRSREFIALLKDLDQYYPSGCTIRIVLDNHSAHISKETRAWLAARPNRFQYVLTPRHGSWLNIVETLFGKMTRTFLRNIRVQSWEELRDRILKGIAEINANPVVHRWKKFEALAVG